MSTIAASARRAKDQQMDRLYCHRNKLRNALEQIEKDSTDEWAQRVANTALIETAWQGVPPKK